MSATYDAAMARLDEILDGIDLPVVEPRVKEMVLAKAQVTTATEAGTFSAVISTVRPDREGDVVLPEAVVDALQAWGTKSIPLAWQHRAEDPDEIIGHIVPASVKAIDGEVQASGWVDRDTPRGKQVWRLVKSNTLGFSYGYLIIDAVKRADGNREIRKIDIFEVSATATPMNADTRVVDWKSTEQPEPEVPSPKELRARSHELERELGLEDPDITRVRNQIRDDMLICLNGEIDTEKTLSPAETLREKSERIAAEHCPGRDRSLRVLSMGHRERTDSRTADSRRPVRTTERQQPRVPGPSTYEGRQYDTTQPDIDRRWIIVPGENRRWY